MRDAPGRPWCSGAPGRPRRAADAAVHVGVDLLLADVLGHGRLVGHRLGVQPDPLDRDGLLGDDRLLLVEDDLVLLLADGGPVGRGADVGVRDRLALETDLLVADRDGLRDVLGDDVLARPGAARLAGLRTDLQALLRARHGVVRGRAGGVVADLPGGARRGRGATLVHHAGPDAGADGVVGPGAGAHVSGTGGVGEAVVRVEPLLLLRRQRA